MRPKGMEDLAAFSAREVKRAAAKDRERDQYYSAEGQYSSAEEKEVRGDDPVEYFLPTGSEVPFEPQRG